MSNMFKKNRVMTQEDKILLLKDLCARLLYGVKGIITYDKSNTTFTIEGIDNNVLHLSDAEDCYVEDFKPYLRPMFSMTEEEEKEYAKIVVKSQNCSFENSESATTMANDWLLSKGFDVRGLISKGLAIEVTEENNPYK